MQSNDIQSCASLSSMHVRTCTCNSPTLLKNCFCVSWNMFRDITNLINDHSLCVSFVEKSSETVSNHVNFESDFTCTCHSYIGYITRLTQIFLSCYCVLCSFMKSVPVLIAFVCACLQCRRCLWHLKPVLAFPAPSFVTNSSFVCDNSFSAEAEQSSDPRIELCGRCGSTLSLTYATNISPRVHIVQVSCYNCMYISILFYCRMTILRSSHQRLT